jgi:hypothetical protein
LLFERIVLINLKTISRSIGEMFKKHPFKYGAIGSTTFDCRKSWGIQGYINGFMHMMISLDI